MLKKKENKKGVYPLLNIVVTEDLKKGLKRLSSHYNLTLSEICRQILSREIEQELKEIRKKR